MPDGTLFKRCGCTELVTDPDGHSKRVQLGGRCPRLQRADGRGYTNHGSWAFQIQISGTNNANRAHLRQSGHETSSKAQAALNEVTALLALADAAEDPLATRIEIAGMIRPALKERRALPAAEAIRHAIGMSLPVDTDPHLDEYLTTWVETRKDLRPNTLRSYRQQIDVLAPMFRKRQVKARRLTLAGGQAVFDELVEAQLVIADENAQRKAVLAESKAAWREHRAYDARRARALLQQMPPIRRVKGPSTIASYLACFRAALEDGLASVPIATNIAKFIHLPEVHRHKPMLWTDERIEHWQQTGELPSAVMIWTEEHLSTFLARAKDKQCGYPYAYFAAFKTIALLGTRRGETLALPRKHISYQTGAIQITQQLVQYGWETGIQPNTKTPDGARTAIAPKTLLTTLAKNAAIQKAHQQAAMDTGEEWTETGLAFTDEHGIPIHPAKLTAALRDIAEQCALPPIRVHDLRHGVVTYARAEGVEDSVITASVGHSNKWFTSKFYGDVIDEAKREASEKLAARYALDDEDD